MPPYYRNGTLHVDCTVRVNGVVWMEGNAWNMHHTFGAMIERAARIRAWPGDDRYGTVGGGSISEAVRKGYPALFNLATSSRWILKELASCAITAPILACATGPHRSVPSRSRRHRTRAALNSVDGCHARGVDVAYIAPLRSSLMGNRR